MSAPNAPAEPAADCALCPRLVEFRAINQTAHPDYFNGAVSSYGPRNARLFILGLAPGLHGANRTGIPFTGDASGDMLYTALLRHGFAVGDYASGDISQLSLRATMISNAVRCVPPQNRPLALEINTCRRFLEARLRSLENLQVIIALGRVAHDSLLRTAGLKRGDAPFRHGARHRLEIAPGDKAHLIDSFHCSRYNLNTGRLTAAMFDQVFVTARQTLANLSTD